MATMVHKIQYLSDCVDDLNSTSRLMRKWLEETPQIVYGEGLWVEVDFLRNNFNDWKQQNGLRGTQSSGAVSRPLPPLLHAVLLEPFLALRMGPPSCGIS